jgi:hypothetical protein
VVALAVAGLAPAGAARAQEDAAPASDTARALVERAFFNLYAEDYIQTLELATEPHGGSGMSRRLQITRKQSVSPGRALLRFLSPYDIRKTSVLILENEGRSDDLYVYLPAAEMTRHLSLAQRGDSFFGTDLSYEDIEPKDAEDYATKLLGPGDLDGRPCRKVELRAVEGVASAYDRMVSCIEPERGLLLWTDFHRRGAVVKRLEIDLESVREVGERFIPFRMSMTDAKRRSRTWVVTESYDVRSEIPDTLFSTWNLQVGDAARDRSRSDPTR